jgi:hypothetical protein
VIGTTVCTSVRGYFLCDPVLKSRHFGIKFVFVLNNAVDFKGVPTSCAATLWPSFFAKGIHF